MKSLSHVQLFATPWTVARQAPLSMGLSRQEYWSGVPFPSQGELPDRRIEPRSPELQADILPTEVSNLFYWQGFFSLSISRNHSLYLQDFRMIRHTWLLHGALVTANSALNPSVGKIDRPCNQTFIFLGLYSFFILGGNSWFVASILGMEVGKWDLKHYYHLQEDRVSFHL